MDITLNKPQLPGRVTVPSSKSIAIRDILCACLAKGESKIEIHDICADVENALKCAAALGAEIKRQGDVISVEGKGCFPRKAVFDCGDSAAVLRLTIPVAAFLGIDSTFLMSEQLSKRPISVLSKSLYSCGFTVKQNSFTLHCSGNGTGSVLLDGSESSQNVSGMLLALPFIPQNPCVTIENGIVSKSYVDLTIGEMKKFGVNISVSENSEKSDKNVKQISFTHESGAYTPVSLAVPGDWSAAAFWICNGVVPENLQTDPYQPDSVIVKLKSFTDNSGLNEAFIDFEDCPDLFPVLSVYAAARGHGVTFKLPQRLKNKESDRILSVKKMLTALGVGFNHYIKDGSEFLFISPENEFLPCVIDSFNDHRIAFAAALAACLSSKEITILNAHCVNKSYPSFWRSICPAQSEQNSR